MKKHLVLTLAQSIMIFCSLLIVTVAVAQSSDKDKKMIADCDKAKAEFLQSDPLLKNVFAG